MGKKIRVIVVDDSALVRSLLAEIINRQSDMECIGTANDPLIAREMIRELNPDVITLDVEMPRMDGIDFLGRLMRLRPMPVLMISTLTERGAEVTLKALELGAVDFVAKPRVGLSSGLNELAGQIVDKIRVAAVAHVRRVQKEPATAANAVHSPSPSVGLLGRLSTEKLIFIGASTGGTEAIKEVLVHMPADSPAIVITQHMPPGFTTSFAARLNGLCQITVKEAVNGERILPGHAYIAPGGKQFHIQLGGTIRRGCESALHRFNGSQKGVQCKKQEAPKEGGIHGVRRDRSESGAAFYVIVSGLCGSAGISVLRDRTTCP